MPTRAQQGHGASISSENGNSFHSKWHDSSFVVRVYQLQHGLLKTPRKMLLLQLEQWSLVATEKCVGKPTRRDEYSRASCAWIASLVATLEALPPATRPDCPGTSLFDGMSVPLDDVFAAEVGDALRETSANWSR